MNTKPKNAPSPPKKATVEISTRWGLLNTVWRDVWGHFSTEGHATAVLLFTLAIAGAAVIIWVAG